MKLRAIAVLSTLLCLAAVSASAYEFSKDMPADIKAQMKGDLDFMATLQGEDGSPLHKEIFGEKIAGSSYKPWFESRITYIGMNACGGGNAVACVIPFFGSSKMWITQNYIKFSHPQIARLMVVHHEARHTEVKNGNWSHATCPTPFLDKDGKEMKSIWTGASLAGEPACDVTPKGSYGSSSILLKNIQKHCTSCSEKVRMDAGIYADDQFGRITDENARRAMLADIFSKQK